MFSQFRKRLNNESDYKNRVSPETAYCSKVYMGAQVQGRGEA